MSDLFSKFDASIRQAYQYAEKWGVSNPGEKAKYEAFADAILRGETPEPPVLQVPPKVPTHFGSALVYAGMMALEQEEQPEPVPEPEPEPEPTDSLWNPSSAINTSIPAGARVVLDKGQGPLASLPGIGLNGGKFGVAVFDSRGKNWPRVTVRNSGGWIMDNVPVPSQLKAYVDAMNEGASEGKADNEKHLIVIDTDRIFNVYGSKFDGTTWTCGALGVLRAPGVSHGFWNNNQFIGGEGGPWLGRASGFCSAAGALTKEEVEAGLVAHALVCGWPKDRINKTGWVAPASSSDGLATSGAPMGSRLQLDPSLTDADFKAFGISDYYLPIARAMQKYGCYIVDSTSWMPLYAVSWTDAGKVTWPSGWYTASAKLVPHLRVVEPPAEVVYDDRSAFGQPHK